MLLNHSSSQNQQFANAILTATALLAIKLASTERPTLPLSQDDGTCLTCLREATLDGTCDTTTTTCAGLADYYCCVAGESCSENPLAAAYISECVGGGGIFCMGVVSYLCRPGRLLHRCLPTRFGNNVRRLHRDVGVVTAARADCLEKIDGHRCANHGAKSVGMIERSH